MINRGLLQTVATATAAAAIYATGREAARRSERVRRVFYAATNRPIMYGVDIIDGTPVLRGNGSMISHVRIEGMQQRIDPVELADKFADILRDLPRGGTGIRVEPLR